MTESNFDTLCDSFEQELQELDGEELNSGTVLTLGNNTWQVHLFAPAPLDNPKEPLLQLFYSRRDLVKAVVLSTGIRSYIKSAYKLATWLEERGYQVGLDAHGFFPRLKLGVFHTYTRVFHFFRPHD